MSAVKRSLEVERKFCLTQTLAERLSLKFGSNVKEKIFKDEYYDTKDFKLTLNNHWLRCREGRWQLKYPPPKSSVTQQGKTRAYEEVDNDEPAIISVIGPFISPESVNSSLQTFCNNKLLSCFASFTTTRKSFRVPEPKSERGDFFIDLDSADFDFCVGEIERIVEDESEIAEAVQSIDKFAADLGELLFIVFKNIR